MGNTIAISRHGILFLIKLLEVVDCCLEPLHVVPEKPERSVAGLAQQGPVALTARLVPGTAIMVVVHRQLPAWRAFADSTHPALGSYHRLELFQGYPVQVKGSFVHGILGRTRPTPGAVPLLPVAPLIKVKLVDR